MSGYHDTVFFFDGRWYVHKQGFWYISQTWKGPFVHFKGKVPPGLLKARKKMRKVKIKGKKQRKKIKIKHKKEKKEEGKGKGNRGKGNKGKGRSDG